MKTRIITLEHDEQILIITKNKETHVKHGDDGVSVSIYNLDDREQESISETWALFSE